MTPNIHFPMIAADKASWYSGFDYLRVLFMIFVICMHLNALLHDEASSLGMHVLHDQFFCSAVPGFLIISVFLRELQQQSNRQKERHFFLRLFYLYAFWVASWALLTRQYPPLTPMGILLFVLQGGGWAFYFFLELIFVHVLRLWITRWRLINLWWGLLAACSLIFVGYALWLHHPLLSSHPETYWWPINFIPAAFLGCLLARYPSIHQVGNSRSWFGCLGALVVLIVVITLIEIRMCSSDPDLLNMGMLPNYLRISPWSVACVSIVVVFPIRKSPAWIQFLARNTLGVFCFHVFVLAGIRSYLSHWLSSEIALDLATIFVVYLGGAVVTEIFRKATQSRLI